MNRNKAIWGITTLALCLALAGCPAEDEENNATLLGVPKMEPISSLHDFPETSPSVRNVGSIAEATALFTNATKTLTTALLAQDKAVYYDTEESGFPQVSAIEYGSGQKTYTIKRDYPLEGFPLDGTGITGTIKGSNTANATVTGLASLGHYYGTNFPTLTVQPITGTGLVDDNNSITEKFSGKRTFAITEGFYGAGTTTDPKVAGYVTIDYSGSATRTLTDKEKQIYTESKSGDIAFSVTIVAYTTAGSGALPQPVGAKFRLSGTIKNNSATTRAVSSGSDIVISNLEVYSNNGKDLHELPADQFLKAMTPSILTPPTLELPKPPTKLTDPVANENWFSFAQSVVARSVFIEFK